MEETARAPLARFTTLKIGGEADRLCLPARQEELVCLLDRLRDRAEPWFVLGGGSNLLISTRGVKGTVIRLTQMTEARLLEDCLVEALAGARLPHLARYAAARGLSGLEFAVGIPGTVGGAVVMNAGAHGSSVSEVLECATVFDTQKWDIVTLGVDELGFAYRRSAIDPDRHIVLSARFRLRADRPEAIQARISANEEYRWRTQPISWPSAGSTFKNPDPDRQAGLLLDRAGAKQMREGGAAVSAVHANFVINTGGATSMDVTALLARMQDCVQKAFSVHLRPEWKHVGTFTDSELAVWNGEP